MRPVITTSEPPWTTSALTWIAPFRRPAQFIGRNAVNHLARRHSDGVTGVSMAPSVVVPVGWSSDRTVPKPVKHTAVLLLTNMHLAVRNQTSRHRVEVVSRPRLLSGDDLVHDRRTTKQFQTARLLAYVVGKRCL